MVCRCADSLVRRLLHEFGFALEHNPVVAPGVHMPSGECSLNLMSTRFGGTLQPGGAPGIKQQHWPDGLMFDVFAQRFVGTHPPPHCLEGWDSVTMVRRNALTYIHAHPEPWAHSPLRLLLAVAFLLCAERVTDCD